MDQLQWNYITIAIIANAILLIAATFLGPVVAVWVTRRIDDQRAKAARKLDIFRAMMRNRRNFLSAEFVGAFNLVEVEYQGVAPVERAYKNVFDQLNVPAASQPDWFDRLRRLTTRLLYAMGKDLGYELEQLDVLEGGYIPTALGQLEQLEEDQNQLRKFLLEIFQGKRSLPVQLASPQRPDLDQGTAGSQS